MCNGEKSFVIDETLTSTDITKMFGKMTRDSKMFNFNQDVNVLDLQFQDQTFGITLFRCNSKTVEPITPFLSVYVHSDNQTLIAKFKVHH